MNGVKNFFKFGLLVQMLLFVTLLPINVSGEEPEDPVQNEESQSDYTAPRGWINAIEDSSVIIDDTYYVFTSQTRFFTNKSQLLNGSFVTFELLKENDIATISLAEPTEEDMYMKPAASVKKSSTGDGEKDDSGPTLKDGVWVY
ncbi:hypothetical protein [Desulfopila sp. IMCC35008]|uniref:hypothetical protein n=1 Tax=Desulfopila sp. IMCC35008 TaxID=2653858 RepID=UPI0013D88FE0|nr:hypothetical protein [Desulfopila sp. IMCC35008]